MVQSAGPSNLAYPLRYAPSRGLQWLVIGACVILGAMGLAAVLLTFLAKDHGVPRLQVFVVCLCILITVFAVYVVRFVYRTALLLHSDRLEYRGGLRTVELKRVDIAGRTPERKSQYATAFKVISLSPQRRKLSIDLHAAPDEAFRA